MFLAEESAQDLILEGADIFNAYLYSEIDVPIITKKSAYSSRELLRSGLVYKLEKTIYETHEAGENWGSLIHYKFISWGFT